MSLDTVAKAKANPDISQPFSELGLKPDEYARIKEILGRRRWGEIRVFDEIGRIWLLY